MAAEKQKRLTDFNQWFTSNGGFIHSAVKFAYSDTKGVHLRVIENAIPPGTLILSCPHTLTLSALNPARICQKFHDWPKNQPSSGSVNTTTELSFPTSFLTEARPQCVAAFFLCYQLLLREDSHWYSYISCLPGPPALSEGNRARLGLFEGLGELDTPVDWKSAEEQRWLRGTAVYQGAIALEDLWQAEWKEWNSMMNLWLTGIDGISKDQRFNWTAFKWAMTVLGSRAFSSAQISAVPDDSGVQSIISRHDPDMLLYPGVDFLNHDPKTRNRWVQDDQMFGVRVYETDLKIGDEIMYSYGAKDNGQLLLSYGFCIENNPDDSFALKLAPLNPNPAIDSFRKTEHMQEFQHQKKTITVAKNHSHSMTPEAYPTQLGSDNVLTERPASHAPPPSHNADKNTFYLRILSTPHDGYPIDDNHFAPFPHTLIHLLTANKVNLRECEDSGALDFDSDRLHENFCGKARMSVMLLVLERLRLDSRRLGNSDKLAATVNITTPADVTAEKREQQRKLWSTIYRSGQRRLVQDIIQLLEDGVADSLQLSPSVSQSSIFVRSRGSLVTVASVLSFVWSILGTDQRIDMDNGLESVFGSSKDVEGWRADGYEEYILTIIIGVILITFDQMPSSTAANDESAAFNNWLVHLKDAYARHVSDFSSTTDGEQEMVDNVLGFTKTMRQKASRAESPNSVWAEAKWLRWISTAVRITRQETLQVVLPEEAYRELRRREFKMLGVEEVEEGELEIEDMETVVALWVE